MQYRMLRRTGLRVSAVGFGTAQLRRVSKHQAIDTLLKGFDLGVNIVHTAPDYEGSEDLVAAAVARTPHKVIVASNGYDRHYNRTGRVRLFERLFEATCRKLRTDRLELFGIASVDDREAFGENVWGRHGMVEFLQRMKARGRLGATFCTTHGKPEFTRKLIESGAFDAVMLAYNDLGFHLLSLHPPAEGQFENIPRTRDELFPLCRQHDVGLMIMLPLAGGLLCRSKAFPREDDRENAAGAAGDVGDVGDVRPDVCASDVLRSVLSHPEVGCVLPGTASVAEAEENALAGHATLPLRPEAKLALGERIEALQTTLCSRCGLCEPTCSQKLPISWMFRAGYLALYPCEPYETWEEVEYFRLHPKLDATCATCPEVTCACPAGIDIPRALMTLNGKMVDQVRRGRVVPPVVERSGRVGNRWFGARLVTREVPGEMRAGQTCVCRLFVENQGIRRWHPPGALHRSAVRLEVFLDEARVASVELRDKVIRGRRCHFVFELTAPHRRRHLSLRLQLVRDHPWLRERKGLVLVREDIPIREEP